MKKETLKETLINTFKDSFKGALIFYDSATYDQERKLYNGMIDKYPHAILKCAVYEDVILAVNFAREHGVLTAIRSGGHNGGGLGSCDDGIVIDTSLMKSITLDVRTNTVRVDAGCTTGDVDSATHEFGLAVPFGIFSTTGVSGLTLGGGLGYLTRKYGLAIDNLLEVRVVLADGRYVTANKHKHPDLFWAVRGGGGNFGVVTSFLFKANPVKDVYGGPVFWEVSKAEKMLRYFDTLMKKASDDLYGFFTLMIIPATGPFPKELWNKNVCGIVWNYTGRLHDAEKIFAEIRTFEKPLLDLAGPLPFLNMQTMFDALYPHGLNWYWKADYVNEISDEAIAQNIRFGTSIPTPLSQTHIYPINGFASRIPGDATAWSYRKARYAQVIVAVDADPDQMENATSWCKAYWEALHPYSAGGAYSNFMMDEGQDRVKAAYQFNYERLAEVKAKYDPHNFFRVNQNIKPVAQTEAVNYQG